MIAEKIQNCDEALTILYEEMLKVDPREKKIWIKKIDKVLDHRLELKKETNAADII